MTLLSSIPFILLFMVQPRCMGVLGELGSLSTSRVQTPEGERTLPDTPAVWLGFLPIFFFSEKRVCSWFPLPCSYRISGLSYLFFLLLCISEATYSLKSNPRQVQQIKLFLGQVKNQGAWEKGKFGWETGGTHLFQGLL